jgi:glycosyltransferase involved in cell wall biosynthesis
VEEDGLLELDDQRVRRQTAGAAAAPAVSVITPTKNRLKLLCETIDSVQAQSFESWEHIIVDDGSDDGTAEEVLQRASADPRIRYIRRSCEKRGANVCRNIGISESRAEFIIFLDSDDLLMPDCLARRIALMERNHDLDFLTFQTEAFENTPGDIRKIWAADLQGDDLLRFLFFELPWMITGPIWRRSSLLRVGMFDEALLSWQDVDLHVRTIATGAKYLRFAEVDHHVRWQFEPTKTSIEQRRSPRHLKATGAILEKIERLVREGPGMTWTRQRAICSLYFFVAENWLAAGNLSPALRSWGMIRRRSLGSRTLYLSGAALLILQKLGTPGRRIGGRITHKWKGWMRLRSEPELLSH